MTFGNRLQNIDETLQSIKATINTALNAKGVPAARSFDDIPSRIADIPSGGGDFVVTSTETLAQNVTLTYKTSEQDNIMYDGHTFYELWDDVQSAAGKLTLDYETFNLYDKDRYDTIKISYNDTYVEEPLQLIWIFTSTYANNEYAKVLDSSYYDENEQQVIDYVFHNKSCLVVITPRRNVTPNILELSLGIFDDDLPATEDNTITVTIEKLTYELQ